MEDCEDNVYILNEANASIHLATPEHWKAGGSWWLLELGVMPGNMYGASKQTVVGSLKYVDEQGEIVDKGLGAAEECGVRAAIDIKVR